MRAAVLTGLGKVVVEDRPEPQARPDWVVVDVESISVCGTDVHQLEGRIETPFPRVPGHDFAGRVSEVGDNVDPGLVGTPVAVKPSLPCMECAVCADKNFDECPRKKLMGLWSDGCMTEKVAVPAVNLVPRPDDVPAWQACLLEPLAVGLNTIDRIGTRLGDTVLVLGQGPIGLCMTRLAALSGAGKLIVTDARDEVFGISTAWGATHTINVRNTDPVAAVAELTDGVGADIVIETSGYPDSAGMVLDVLRKKGKLAMVGFAKDLPPLPIIPMLMKTLTLFAVGGNGGFGQYERSLELLHTGRVELDKLVTHRFSLDDVAEALDTGLHRKGGAIKIVIAP
jgi:2-desacetyl-2-hydroxyethyl bacteriochlorophyllide A dehydrogenase